MLSQIGRRKIFCQILTVAFGFLLSALQANPAQAQGFLVELGMHREGTNDPKPPVFRVTATNNKKVYDTVEDTYKGIRYKIKVKGQCPEKHHLSTSSIRLSNKVAAKQVIFPVNENNRSIGADHGQEWNQYNFDFPFLLPKVSPVETCNAEVKRRQASGQSLAAILQNGFTVEVDDAYTVTIVIGCEKNVHLWYYEMPQESASATLPATVECRPTGYVPTQGVPSKPGQHREPPPQRTPVPEPPLSSVSVMANPAETKGEGCPVYVNFKGKIEANAESEYSTFNTKYRFTGDHGYQTDWTFVSVSRSEPRTVNVRRFIQAPVANPGGTILAPGVRPRIPLFRGWMELEVQLPNGSKRSERANFSVDCNVAPDNRRIRASTPNSESSDSNDRGAGVKEIQTEKEKDSRSNNRAVSGRITGIAVDPDQTNNKIAPGLPDLIIKQFLFPPTNDKALRVQVVNQGNSASDACRLILTIRKIGENAVGRRTHVNISQLAPGKSIWLHIDANSILPNDVSLKDTNFKLNADGTELVAESNEGNNEVWHKQ